MLIKSMLEALESVQEKLVDIALTIRVAVNQIRDLTNDMAEDEEE